VNASSYFEVLNVEPNLIRRGIDMAGSTYKIIELVGTSDVSWEDAAKTAVETAGESLRDLRIAEVTKLDMTLEEGKVRRYRTRVNVSFKFEK
jgi:flavin-binding protein dodecin